MLSPRGTDADRLDSCISRYRVLDHGMKNQRFRAAIAEGILDGQERNVRGFERHEGT